MVRGADDEGEGQLVGTAWIEGEGEPGPASRSGKADDEGARALEDQGPAPRRAVHQGLARRVGQRRPPQDLALEPAPEVLGEEDQLLVEGDPGPVAGREVAAGEDPLPLLDPGFNLPTTLPTKNDH